MKPAVNFKREAIRYWEVKRGFWNVLLVFPSLLGYGITAGMASGLGDPPAFGWAFVVLMFFFCAVGANILYCSAYVIEFLIQGATAEVGYRSRGRHALFVLGCLIGVCLALSCGASIAHAQYHV